MSEVTDLHQQVLEAVAHDAINNLAAYQELLAGAYAKVCKLDPRDCIIVQQHTREGIQTFYTNRKPWVANDVVAAVSAENDALRGRIKDLEDEVKRAYQDGFSDGYCYVPDFGHGKAEKE